jgi:type IV pilus assembly protein PilF
MRIALAIAILAAVLAGCASQSTTETRPVTDNRAADGRRRAELHTLLAGEYYSRGNFTVALAEARSALKDDPSYFPAYNIQGLIYMEVHEDAQARESFNQALKLSPNNAEVLNNFGWFLCLRNDTERGLEMIHRATTDNFYPTPEKAFLSAGLCLRRLGRTQEAEEQLRRAVLIRPDLIGALFNLAAITYERGALKDAETYLLRYMRLTGSPSLEALTMGVRIARGLNDSSAEQSYLQQLRRRFPDAPEARELLEKRP